MYGTLVLYFVNASSFKGSSFWEWVAGAKFAPSPFLAWDIQFVREDVEGVEQVVCPECAEVWAGSRIRSSLAEVDWKKLMTKFCITNNILQHTCCRQ